MNLLMVNQQRIPKHLSKVYSKNIFQCLSWRQAGCLFTKGSLFTNFIFLFSTGFCIFWGEGENCHQQVIGIVAKPLIWFLVYVLLTINWIKLIKQLISNFKFYCQHSSWCLFCVIRVIIFYCHCKLRLLWLLTCCYWRYGWLRWLNIIIWSCAASFRIMLINKLDLVSLIL